MGAMPVKYVCPRCGRRFAEWGAEKHGFKCPGDEWCPQDRPDNIELLRVGMQEERSGKKPTLKRPVKRAAVVPSSMNEDEILVPDIEEIEADTVPVEEEFDEAEAEEEEVLEPEAEVEAVVEVVTPVPVEDDELAADEDEVLEDDAGLVVDETLEDADDIADDGWKG